MAGTLHLVYDYVALIIAYTLADKKILLILKFQLTYLLFPPFLYTEPDYCV